MVWIFKIHLNFFIYFFMFLIFSHFWKINEALGISDMFFNKIPRVTFRSLEFCFEQDISKDASKFWK